MTSDVRRELAEEYKILHQRWDDFSGRALSIKGFVLAGMIAGAAQLEKASDPAVWAIIALTLSAWYLEAIWKAWQHANWQRLQTIERAFRETDFSGPPYQLHTAFTAEMEPDKWTRVRREMGHRFVMLPYIVFIVICLFNLTLIERMMACLYQSLT